MEILPKAFEALAAYNQWVCWFATPRPEKPGKFDKKPCNWETGAICNAHDPVNWATAGQALASGSKWDQGHGSGVGFVLTENDPFFFLDIDNAFHGGRWSAVAEELCAQLQGAAVEVSHSNRGLHIFGQTAPFVHGTRNTPNSLELYTSGRFAALTGLHALGDAGADLTAPLAAVAAKWFPPGRLAQVETKGSLWTTEPAPNWDGPTDDGDLIKRAMASGSHDAEVVFGAKLSFADLWEGRIDPNCRSEADQSLATRLAIRTGNNCERIERLMRASALNRSKWDDHPTYLRNTILKACNYGKNTAAAAVPRPTASDDWPTIDLSVLDGPQITAPMFPADILGGYWSNWCATAAKGANAPPDYSAVGLLTLAGALLGNTRVIAASPDWHEPPVIWSMLVGVPSAGKSPALDPLVRIFERLESEMSVEFEGAIRQHETAVEVAKGHRETWVAATKAAVKNGGEASEMPADAQEPPPLARPRVRLSDATLEAAADIAAGNPKGLLLYRDELAGWWRGFNRYGGDGERQFWLQAYGARPYTVDRKKVGKPVVIERLAISVLGGSQPDVLASMLEGEADGFAARFLFAFPDPVPGFKLAGTPIDHDGAYSALLRLHTLDFVDEGSAPRRPHICRLAPAAQSRFERWWSDRRSAAQVATGLWGGWLGKQGGQALRIALVVEHLWWCASANSADSANGSPKVISAEAMDSAIKLIDGWAAAMAQRAFGWAGLSPEEAEAAALARWLKRKRAVSFNARDARRSGDGPGGRLVKAAHMKAACEKLVEAGIIRHVGLRSDGKAGRPPEDYAVNPALIEGAPP